MKWQFSKRTSPVLGLAVVGILALASCGDDSAEPGTDADVAFTSQEPSPFIDPENVLLAGLILTIGDIDRAVAEGLVNPLEVDAAVEAMDQGTMEDWVGRTAGEDDQ
jgi:hypothetical protein